MRELSGPYSGVEYLDEKKVIAIIDSNGLATPQDGLEKYSNETIEKWVNDVGLKMDKTGLFYCNGLYRTWAQRDKAQKEYITSLV
jgi:hypothetical protein